MSTPLTRFAFVDAVHAAEALRVTKEEVLDMVASGKLRTFGGKPDNPFFRSADIALLVQEIGVVDEEPAKRTKSATAKVQQRLTADSRWSDISIDDIRDWAQRADPARRQAARTAASTAVARLTDVLRILDEL